MVICVCGYAYMLSLYLGEYTDSDMRKRMYVRPCIFIGVPDGLMRFLSLMSNLYVQFTRLPNVSKRQFLFLLNLKN